VGQVAGGPMCLWVEISSWYVLMRTHDKDSFLLCAPIRRPAN
jgi:hypothetical protein